MTRKLTFLMTAMALILAIMGPRNVAWGQTTTYTMQSYSNNIITSDNDATWATSSACGGSELPYALNSKRGAGFQANNTVTSSISVTNASKITVIASSNGNKTTTLAVKVGNTTFGNTVSVPQQGYQTLEFTAPNNTPVSGTIVFTITRTSKTLWIGQVIVETASTPSTVAAPTFNPAGGEYVEAQTVTISTETEDATIYYNFTGEEPWTEYTTPVTISQTSTLYAYATKTDCEDSEIASAAYTISSTITLNAPTLTITAGNAKVTPTWAAVEHATSYTLEYATESAFASPTTITSAVSGTDITGLTNETTYYFRIKAIGDETYLTSGWSATVSATPSAVVTMSIDFESESSTYTDWKFSSMTSKQSNITAHGGSYIGTTGGKETASITTKNKIINPLTFTCYVSKASNNTTSSNWKVQISSDGSSWTDVKTQSATSMSQGEWVEISQDLSVYHNVYVRIYYTGSSAIRTIDDLTLTYAPAEYYAITIDENIQNGTVEADKETATVGEIVTLTAEPNSSFILGTWNVTYIDGDTHTVTVTDNTFSMPAFPVTVSATFIERPAATFTNGVYTESFASDFGQWITYNEIGDQVWNISNGYAHINGYSGGAKDNIDWLISPKMTAENAKLIVNFISKLNYSNQNSSLVMKYSTDYSGTGDPTSANWTALSPTIATQNSDTNSGDVEIEEEYCYVAFIYTSTASGAAEYFIKNFNAKQCYTVTYNANNGSGEMTDTNSPYTVGAEVTTLKNTFTAPAATPNFAGWNTEADGTGYSYNEEANFNMPAENVILYAQWTATVVYTITVEASEYGTVESDKATAEAGETVTLTVTPNEHYQLQSITATSGEGENVYITNEYTFVMPDNNVTITATFEPIMYTVSFSVNDNTEILASTSVQEGSAIGTLPTPDAEYIPTGFDFAGWTLDENEIDFLTAPIQVNNDMILYAVFSRIEGGSGETTWNLVTNSSEIVAGKVIKIAATVSGSSTTANNGTFAANGTISSSIMGKVSATISDNKLTNDEGAAEFTIGGTSGNWTLAYDGKLLGATAAKKLAYDDGTTTWGISIDGNAKASIANGTTSYGTILYNRDSPRFTTYTSTPSATMVLPQIFVKTVSGTTHYYTRVFLNETVTDDITIAGPTIIPAGSILDMGSHNLTNTNPANLVIEDGGQLICYNEVAATVKKNIIAHDETSGWYTIASPIDGSSAVSTVQTTESAYDLYRFNQAANFEWENVKAHSTDFTTLNNGTGYLYANSADVTLEFAGTLRAGNEEFEIELSYASGNWQFKGFNLVGNPFAHNISMGSDVKQSNNNTGYYVVEHGSNLVVKTSETPIIKPCQGFMVQATGEGQKITFNPSSSAKETQTEHEYITIAAGNGDFMDMAYICTNADEKLGKITLDNPTAKVYLQQNENDYAIAPLGEATSMVVCFKAPASGTYTINVSSDVEGVSLKDMKTGYVTYVNHSASYTFEAGEDDAEGRFKILFGTTGVEENEAQMFVMQSGSDLIISGEGTVQIIDMMGRVLRSAQVESNATVSTEGMTAGAYVVRMLTAGGVQTQKVIVK